MDLKTIKRFMPLIAINIFLFIGCVLQIITISQHFFSYPTTVSIKSKWSAIEYELSAISFCFERNENNNGSYIKDLKDKIISNDFINNCIYFKSSKEMFNCKNLIQSNLIESFSFYFHCLTLNDNLNGNFMVNNKIYYNF